MARRCKWPGSESQASIFKRAMSMTTNYSPGPWRVVGYGTIAAGQSSIAETAQAVNGSANARLIAAAPDGHKLAEHIDAMANDAYLVGHPEWAEIVDEARELIAKVEGARV